MDRLVRQFSKKNNKKDSRKALFKFMLLWVCLTYMKDNEKPLISFRIVLISTFLWSFIFCHKIKPVWIRLCVYLLIKSSSSVPEQRKQLLLRSKVERKNAFIDMFVSLVVNVASLDAGSRPKEHLQIRFFSRQGQTFKNTSKSSTRARLQGVYLSQN